MEAPFNGLLVKNRAPNFYCLKNAPALGVSLKTYYSQNSIEGTQSADAHAHWIPFLS